MLTTDMEITQVSRVHQYEPAAEATRNYRLDAGELTQIDRALRCLETDPLTSACIAASEFAFDVVQLRHLSAAQLIAILSK
jgi:hypothetical protein